MSVVDRLAPIRLASVGGGDVELGSLWREKTVLLTFIRHFG